MRHLQRRKTLNNSRRVAKGLTRRYRKFRFQRIEMCFNTAYREEPVIIRMGKTFMKKIIFLALVTTLGLIAACNFSNKTADAEAYRTAKNETENKTTPNNNKKLVLVELFTSEGCSSCPPADRALAKLQIEQPIKNAEIITLAFHVDYWNYLGWKDEFSSAEYSRRQSGYSNAFGLNNIYTPQMIVDGQSQFTGSGYEKALTEIGKAANENKGEVKLSLEEGLLKPNLKVEISGLDTKEGSDVFLAIAEDNLTNNIKRGENSGKTLSHMSVVRNLLRIGTVAAGEKTFETEKSVELNSAWKQKNLNLVVFVQNKNSKNIAAVGKTAITDNG